MRCIRALAVHGAGGDVEEWKYTPIPLEEDQVEVKIECCGVCHSDLHQAKNDWGVANYPLVVGHEIIGQVVSKGSRVSGLEIGDRVGIGPQTGSCQSCGSCDQGQDQHCSRKYKSYNSVTGNPIQPHTYGGFAEAIRVKAKWAFKIPDGMDSIATAPLLCAGITTWMPLVRHKLGKGHVVGILGIGGLGHVAIQFAHHLGAHVVALSSSSGKEEEAKSLGADEFLITRDAAAMRARDSTFDFILCTVSAELEWVTYFKLLKPEGKLCMVGLPPEIKFNPMILVNKSLEFCGSYLASPSEIKNMLTFCAKNKIKAMVETHEMTAENANLALDRLEKNLPRYRIVLCNAKL